jgi:hypothetical protein
MADKVGDIDITDFRRFINREIEPDDPEFKEMGFETILQDDVVASSLNAMQGLMYAQMIMTTLLQMAGPWGMAIAAAFEIMQLLAPLIIGLYMRVEEWILRYCDERPEYQRIKDSIQEATGDMIQLQSVLFHYVTRIKQLEKEAETTDNPQRRDRVLYILPNYRAHYEQYYNKTMDAVRRIHGLYSDLGYLYKAKGYYAYYYLNTRQITNFEFGIMVKKEFETLAQLRDWQENAPREYERGGTPNRQTLFFTNRRTGGRVEVRGDLLSNGYIDDDEQYLMLLNNLFFMDELREFQRLLLLEERKISRDELEIMRQQEFHLIEQLFAYLGKSTDIDERLLNEERLLMREYGVRDVIRFRIYLAQQLLINGKITEQQFRAFQSKILAGSPYPVQQLFERLQANISGRQQLYKSGQITKEQLKFMTELGLYTLRDLKLHTQPSFEVGNEIYAMRRKNMLAAGQITKEEYNLMVENGLYSINHLRRLQDRIREAEVKAETERRQKIRDELLKNKKITESEFKTMNNQNLYTIDQLRTFQNTHEYLRKRRDEHRAYVREKVHNLFMDGYVTHRGYQEMVQNGLENLEELRHFVKTIHQFEDISLFIVKDDGKINKEDELQPGYCSMPLTKIYKGFPQIPGLYASDDQVVVKSEPYNYYKFDINKPFYDKKEMKESKMDKYKKLLKFNDPINALPFYYKVKSIMEDPKSYENGEVPAELNFPQEPPMLPDPPPEPKPKTPKLKVSKPKAKPEPYPKFEIEQVVDVPSLV